MRNPPMQDDWATDRRRSAENGPEITQTPAKERKSSQSEVRREVRRTIERTPERTEKEPPR